MARPRNTRILIEVSARHAHLTRAHARKLFGHPPTPLREISQPGQYAAEESVTLEQKIKGKMFRIERVRVVGPTRKESQIELALSDCRALGIEKPVIKVSGSLRGTPGIALRGPRGKISLRQGVIVAQRHIHCPPGKAKELGLRNGSVVCVRVAGKRSVTFENVFVRVNPNFRFRMHIDTDEANAAGVESGMKGLILT